MIEGRKLEGFLKKSEHSKGYLYKQPDFGCQDKCKPIRKKKPAPEDLIISFYTSLSLK